MRVGAHRALARLLAGVQIARAAHRNAGAGRGVLGEAAKLQKTTQQPDKPNLVSAQSSKCSHTRKGYRCAPRGAVSQQCLALRSWLALATTRATHDATPPWLGQGFWLACTPTRRCGAVPAPPPRRVVVLPPHPPLHQWVGGRSRKRRSAAPNRNWQRRPHTVACSCVGYPASLSPARGARAPAPSRAARRVTYLVEEPVGRADPLADELPLPLCLAAHGELVCARARAPQRGGAHHRRRRRQEPPRADHRGGTRATHPRRGEAL